MPQEKLTALFVERTHRKGLPIALNDGGGLYFRKQTASGATWMLRYRFAGTPKWMALGNYPDMSLAQARKEARAKRVLLDTQKDPLAEKRAARIQQAGRRSFSDLAADWLASEIEGRVKHPEVPKRYLDKYLVPRLRTKKADEVTTDDIMAIVDEIKRKKPAAANDLLRFTRRIFDFGVRRRRVPFNPAGGLVPGRDGGGTERARQRSLSRDELSVLFSAMRQATNFSTTNRIAVSLLLALFVRKNQLLAAQWKEFDLVGETELGPFWRLPASRAKTEKVALDIPLVPAVVEWLRTLHVLSDNSPYLFPRQRHDRRSRSSHIGPDTLNAALAELNHGLEHFTVHDFRRTGRTHLAALGVRREVAERCLAHKFKGVEGVYDTHPYFDERRDAMHRWTDVLVAADRGKTEKKPPLG